MSDFKVIEVLDSRTFRVEPSWHFSLNENTEFVGNKIRVRGLDLVINDLKAKDRLEKLLLQTKSELFLRSPEIVEYNDSEDAIVSCSVYLGQTNIVYYFPEYVHASQ